MFLCAGVLQLLCGQNLLRRTQPRRCRWTSKEPGKSYGLPIDYKYRPPGRSLLHKKCLKLAAKLVVILAISILLLLPRTTLFYFLLSNIDMVGVISPWYSEIPTQVDQKKHAWLLCSYIEILATMQLYRNRSTVPENSPGWGGYHPSYLVTQFVQWSTMDDQDIVVRAQALYCIDVRNYAEHLLCVTQSNFSFHNHPKLWLWTGLTKGSVGQYVEVSQICFHFPAPFFTSTYNPFLKMAFGGICQSN